VNIVLSIVMLALQVPVTPPPAPPVLVTPAASPSASAAPSPTASPGALSASLTAVNLHPSQSQPLTIANVNGTLAAQLDTPLVTVSIDQQNRTVTLTAAAQTGRAMLTVSDSSGASLQIPVRVALDAGTVPGTLSLRVTGTVDPAWLQAQVQKIVARSVQLQPGASMQAAAFTVPSPFAAGATAAVPVAVHIAGGESYYDVDATATVNLQNVDTPAFTPPLLFYDDDPEKIVANGVLYRNEISADAPARLYYYHQNSGDPRRLVVALRALQAPATVHLLDASAGPNADVMTVGHNVSRDFLLQKQRNEGVIVDVNSPSPYVVDDFRMQGLDGAAGSIGMQVLSGGPVQVTVAALPPDISDEQAAAFLDQPQLPDDGHHRTGTFRIVGSDGAAYGSEVLAYTVGAAEASTQYGATSPPPADGAGGHDYGDYGVVRTFTFDLSNPTQQASTLYLYERPMGGVVRSSFLLNGTTLVQPGCARLPERYQVGEPFSVPPQSNVQLTVQTMTDGGSNYPLELGVTPTPPLPTTPAISAPDGCFPKQI
jgi:hypothetical protein